MMYFVKFCKNLICPLYFTIQGNFSHTPAPSNVHKIPPGIWLNHYKIALHKRTLSLTNFTVPSEGTYCQTYVVYDLEKKWSPM